MAHSLTEMATAKGHPDPVELVAQALRDNDGSPSKAAISLGVSETALRYWMTRHLRVTRRTVVDVERITPVSAS